MDSVMNKTRLAEIRYWDKPKKEIIKIITINYKKQKRQRNYKRKSKMSFKKEEN